MFQNQDVVYFMRNLRPDIANATQELSKIMGGANLAAFLEMHCVIKYVLDTRDLGVVIESNRNEEKLKRNQLFGNNNHSLHKEL